jgi:hypothetical protein
LRYLSQYGREPTEPKDRIRYYFGVVRGCWFWLRYDVSLAKAWTYLLLLLGGIVLLGSYATVAPLTMLLFVFLSFLWPIVAFITIGRLSDWSDRLYEKITKKNPKSE